MSEEPGQADAPRSLTEAIAALRAGDLSHTRVARLSDLSRTEARIVADAWLTIPEATRADIVRRFDELSEERIDVNFRRALRVALDDPSPVVRQLAIAGLWEDDSADLLERLLDLMRGDPSPDVQAEAARGLERYASRAAVGDLEDDIADRVRRSLMAMATGLESSFVVQRRALESLGPLGAEPEVASVISDVYELDDHGLRCSTVYAMGKSQQPNWLPTILRELESDEAELRYEAARAAGFLGSSDALPLLIEAARDDDAEVRHAAIAAIGQIGGRGAVRALERLADDAGEADLELIESAVEDVNAVLDPFQST